MTMMFYTDKGDFMKDKISLLLKIIIVIVSGIGLYLNFKLLTFRESVIYFTIQSNILCFIFFLIVVILTLCNKLHKNEFYYISKGMVTMAITITMFVYQLLLSSAGGMGAYTNHALECNFVHLFVPILVIADYILFGEKGNLKRNYPFYWSIVLLAYVIFNIIYVSLGGRFQGGATYPYFYMNIDEYGLFGVFMNCLVVYIFFVGYGFIVQWLDSRLAKKLNK